MLINGTILSNILLFSAFAFSRSEDVGDQCQVLGRSGFCTLDNECQIFRTLNAAERRVVVAARCGFQGSRSVICCPAAVPTIIDKRRSSKKMCDQLAQRPVELINPANPAISRILASEDALDGEFPQFAALGYQDILETTPTFDCGGVLISKNFVLTAAFCLSLENPVKFVRMGTVALKGGIDFRAYINRLDIDVKSQLRHPNYTEEIKLHDIGLVELKTDVAYTFRVWPACLHQGEDLLGKSLGIAGFGVTDDLGIATDRLGKAEVSGVSLDECSEAFQNIPDFRSSRVIPDDIKNGYLCAKNAEGSKSCQGDEGSGLYLKPDNKTTDKRFVVGIASFRSDCESPAPAVYTKVSLYLDWIENIVWP